MVLPSALHYQLLFVVLRIYVTVTIFQLHVYCVFEAGDTQALKAKWQDWVSNPGLLALQSKSLTTRPLLLSSALLVPYKKPHNFLLKLQSQSVKTATYNFTWEASERGCVCPSVVFCLWSLDRGKFHHFYAYTGVDVINNPIDMYIENYRW